MKKIIHQDLRFAVPFLVLFTLLIVNTGCKKHDSPIPLFGYQQVNLVANSSAYGAAQIEPNLLNAWGMSSDEGEIWVSAADGGVSFVYDKTGATLMPPVAIPSHIPKAPGNPTGNVYNETTDFVIPGTNEPAEFIFASEDGTISAWNSGNSAILIADRSADDASYKGIAIANDGYANFLYVTNFSEGKIDVYDQNFNYTSNKPFYDNTIPSGYAPFNIRNIHDMLYVTYALRTADGEEDSTGLGLGFVDVFWPNGSLAKRFASHGSLNAPWGIAEARPGFCDVQNAILIGNFGDGHINVFDLNGKFHGLLIDHGKPISIEGLWALDNNIEGIDPKQLYFTAGPNDEADGLFGYLMKR